MKAAADSSNGIDSDDPFLLSSSTVSINGGVHQHVHSPGHCVDHDEHDIEDEDEGDEWLKGIQPCSIPGITPQHVHIKVAVDEKQAKRRFF